MEIVIRNYLSGSFLLAGEPREWDAIVILDSNLRESSFVEQHSHRHLILRFDDVTKSDSRKLPPSLNDVAEAFEFAATSKKLMVCCRAGQSRSAALAFSIGYRFLGNEAAISLWNPKRHSPNQLVIELASQLMEDPDFLMTVHNWRTENQNISLSDYLDEIEAEFDELEAQGATNRIIHS